MLRHVPRTTFVLSLGLVVAFCIACAGSAGETARAGSTPGWATHTEPGFTLEAPTGWKVVADRAAGRVQVTGPRGESVAIWAMTLERPDLDAATASVLLAHMARTADATAPWTTSPSSAPRFARIVSRGGGRDAVIIVHWTPGDGRTTVVAYQMQAPSGAYAASADIFTRIAGSFRVQGAAGRAASASPAGTAGTRYVRWSDPRENAFSVSVPDGWRAFGGSYRLSATDVRPTLTAVSPDGAIRVMIGDPNLGGFTMPTQMLAFAGLREGGQTSIGDGTVLQILRFMPGQAFVRQYVQRAMQQMCGGTLRIVSDRDRPDLAGTFAGQARAEGMPTARLSAGDVSFSCSVNGRPMEGYYAAGTIVPLPGTGPLWYAYRLYGIIAPPERRQEAETVCRRILESWQIDEAWREKERQIAANAVQQDAIRSQQVRARALKAIADDLRQTSDMVASSYWQRQSVYDEISRRRENATLGTVDVVDPDTGRQFTIEYHTDNHWMNGQGHIVGTLTDTPPGVGWRKLIDLQ